MNSAYKRLESLDVLRGFDLFCLVALEGILHPLGRAIDASWYNDFLWGFSHVQWEEQPELRGDGADRTLCRTDPEKCDGSEAQMAMAAGGRRGNGCLGLVVGIAASGDQEDMDEFDGAGQQRLLFSADGRVLLLDRL